MNRLDRFINMKKKTDHVLGRTQNMKLEIVTHKFGNKIMDVEGNLDEIIHAMKTGGVSLMIAPTGSGKTESVYMINQIEDQQELMAEMYQEMEQRDGQLILFQEQNQRLQELNNELQEQLQILPSIEELLELLEKKDGEIQTLKEENWMLKDENQQWKELTEKLNDENRLLQRQNEELLNCKTD